jgi:hypothetical protein
MAAADGGETSDDELIRLLAEHAESMGDDNNGEGRRRVPRIMIPHPRRNSIHVQLARRRETLPRPLDEL